MHGPNQLQTWCALLGFWNRRTMVESKIIIHNKSAEVIATGGTKIWFSCFEDKHQWNASPMFPMFCAAFCPDILNILNILTFSTINRCPHTWDKTDVSMRRDQQISLCGCSFRSQDCSQDFRSTAFEAEISWSKSVTSDMDIWKVHVAVRGTSRADNDLGTSNMCMEQ